MHPTPLPEIFGNNFLCRELCIKLHACKQTDRCAAGRPPRLAHALDGLPPRARGPRVLVKVTGKKLWNTIWEQG